MGILDFCCNEYNVSNTILFQITSPCSRHIIINIISAQHGQPTPKQKSLKSYIRNVKGKKNIILQYQKTWVFFYNGNYLQNILKASPSPTSAWSSLCIHSTTSVRLTESAQHLSNLSTSHRSTHKVLQHPKLDHHFLHHVYQHTIL